MRYKIAIVEDSNRSVDIIKNYLEEFTSTTNVLFDIYVFNDGEEIMFDYEPVYDIIFLDIEMKRLNGMDTAKKIRKIDTNVIIIFITNNSQYAVKGYQVDAMSYLLKPVGYFAFQEELKKSLASVDKLKKKEFLLIPTPEGLRKIDTNEIMYIESIRHYLLIVTVDKTYEIRGTLKKMEEKLENLNFNRCNNCYLVNLAYVEGVEAEFAIVGAHKLKISRPRKKNFIEQIVNYLGVK
jgi:DNA-binding LytR/AlgR family response regulator